MLEERGNIFETEADVLVVTTNGFVKRNGECVMGAGCAREATKRFGGIAKILGDAITKHGNVVNYCGTWLSPKGKNMPILSFPVKPAIVTVAEDGSNIVEYHRAKQRPGATAPGFMSTADPEIIARSVRHLREYADANPEWKRIVLPRPGCGHGELQWKDIRPILAQLDNRFVCMTF